MRNQTRGWVAGGFLVGLVLALTLPILDTTHYHYTGLWQRQGQVSVTEYVHELDPTADIAAQINDRIASVPAGPSRTLKGFELYWLDGLRFAGVWETATRGFCQVVDLGPDPRTNKASLSTIWDLERIPDEAGGGFVGLVCEEPSSASIITSSSPHRLSVVAAAIAAEGRTIVDLEFEGDSDGDQVLLVVAETGPPRSVIYFEAFDDDRAPEELRCRLLGAAGQSDEFCGGPSAEPHGRRAPVEIEMVNLKEGPQRWVVLAKPGEPDDWLAVGPAECLRAVHQELNGQSLVEPSLSSHTNECFATPNETEEDPNGHQDTFAQPTPAWSMVDLDVVAAPKKVGTLWCVARSESGGPDLNPFSPLFLTCPPGDHSGSHWNGGSDAPPPPP